MNFPVYLSLTALVTAFLGRTSIHSIPEVRRKVTAPERLQAMLTFAPGQQGHVGMYWRGGRLLNRITQPGIHARLPLIDTFEAVQVRK